MTNKNMIAISIIFVALITIGSSALYAATLKWVPGTGTADGFKIYYGQDKANLIMVESVGSTIRSYSLDSISLAPNLTYYFAVTAFNSEGESDYSNFSEYTPGEQTPPIAPTGLRVE